MKTRWAFAGAIEAVRALARWAGAITRSNAQIVVEMALLKVCPKHGSAGSGDPLHRAVLPHRTE